MNFARKETQACKIATESAVLLKNDNRTLPLSKGSSVAMFGGCSYFCFKSGFGSGDVFVPTVQPYDYIKENSVFETDENIAEYYSRIIESKPDTFKYWNRKNGNFADIPPDIKPRIEEPEIPSSVIEKSAQKCSTAIITIGRNEGESMDLPDGILCLFPDEEAMIKTVTEQFEKTVLILNTPCPIDLDFLSKYRIDAIIYIGFPGETAGMAIAELLTGKVTPSGKLTDTWAPIDSYPTHYGFRNDCIPYNEGIFVGYRYFDTFNKPIYYPFGFGISYTDFNISVKSAELSENTVLLKVNVINTGDFSGKEVVEVYLSAPDGKLEKAYQSLATFKKTPLLAPSQEVTLSLDFNFSDFASYDEKTATYILEKGDYFVRVGNSSRNTKIALCINVDATVVTARLKNNCTPKEHVDLISKVGAVPYTYSGEADEKADAKRVKYDVSSISEFVPEYSAPLTGNPEKSDKKITLDDVRNGKYTLEEFVSTFTLEQLADIMNGITDTTLKSGGAIGGMSKKVKGAAGETWGSEELKIPVTINADGPQGIRISGHMNHEGVIGQPDYPLSLAMTCYPAACLAACSWDEEVGIMFGRSVADDMKYANIETWLAPGMNIHRNPYCGRNFEYFSEDPIISGKMAMAITCGVQTNPDGTPSHRAVTIKHFCSNNQEKYRITGDSQVSERALREIYLKGFEIAVKTSQPIFLMNSYNKLNGIFTAENFELNTSILRDEWGFEGAVMTDWVGDPDSKGIPLSGCDISMPGLRNKEYLEYLLDGTFPREMAEKRAVTILKAVLKLL